MKKKHLIAAILFFAGLLAIFIRDYVTYPFDNILLIMCAFLIASGSYFILESKKIFIYMLLGFLFLFLRIILIKIPFTKNLFVLIGSIYLLLILTLVFWIKVTYEVIKKFKKNQ